jgi:hypothetical protein
LWDSARPGPGASATDSAGGTEAFSHRADRADSEPGDGNTEGQIYVWNLGETTETFPSVPGDED